MSDVGRQVQFTLTLKEDREDGALTKMDMAMLYPCDIFLRPNGVASGTSIFGLTYEKLQDMEKEWWRMGCAGSETVMPLALDPALVTLQSDIFIVTEEKEREKVNGRDAYHYAIVLDQGKFMSYVGSFSSGMESREGSQTASLQRNALKGEVWVDTRTYDLHRLLWTVGDGRGGEVARFDLLIRDHGGVPSIPLPSRARLLTGSTLTEGEIPSIIPGIQDIR